MMKNNIFNFMFNDNKFCLKAGLFSFYLFLLLYCGVFSLTGGKNTIQLDFINYLMIFLVNLILYSIYEGYKITTIRALKIFPDNIIIPFLNIKKNFIQGFKYLLSLFLFTTPCLLIISAFAFVLSIIPSSPEFGLKQLFGILTLLIIIYSLYLTYFLPASLIIFIKTNSIWSLYKFKNIFEIVTKNPKKYTKCTLLYFLFNLIIGECFRLSIYLINKNTFLILLVLLLTPLCIYLFYIVCKLISNIDS